jgi:hypothetical protein
MNKRSIVAVRSTRGQILHGTTVALLTLLVGAAAFAGGFQDDFPASPYSRLSRDYFDRFALDVQAKPADNETRIAVSWRIVIAKNADPVTSLMAVHLSDFLRERMGLMLPVLHHTQESLAGESKAIVLDESGAGVDGAADGFAISVTAEQIRVSGKNPDGLRDGIVKLVDQMGFREAPILVRGEQAFKPRLGLRVGFKPTLGTMRDVVFGGYNAVTTGMTDLYKLSTSACIPELTALQDPAYRERVAWDRQDAHRHGLKTYCYVHTMTKFAEDAPIFKAHPEIRGVRTWLKDGLFTLCTETPLVKQYLKESVQSLFRDDPKLDGLLLIIGGEGFYHCFMRPYGVELGETPCERCKALGPDAVVANLCNGLAEAAREINPNAEIVVWPYSAASVWSSDKAQTGFLRKLKPGVALLTEIEKDEVLEKPEGVKKVLWDYSIDLIGPGERAKEQVALCRAQGTPVYLKSEPELAFEASGLPHIPCMDRWAARADALASSGANGAWVFPAYLPHRGTSTAEVYKYFWWDPVPDRGALLDQFAARLAGKDAGPMLREAWRLVSESIEFSPEIPPYYNGPHYFGPAHPMCADPDAKLPREFYAGYGFYAEANPDLVAVQHPVFVTVPTGNEMVFPHFYRQMEDRLNKAVGAITAAEPLVNTAHRLTFDSEASMVRWLYHIARTEANFYDAFLLRRELGNLLTRVKDGTPLGDGERAETGAKLARWREILSDELANAGEALPVMEADMRLDFRYMRFCPGPEMIRTKMSILQKEIDEYLPSVATRLGF